MRWRRRLLLFVLWRRVMSAGCALWPAMLSDRVGVVDFPTLGDLIDAWVTQHCRIPDRHARGQAFRKYDWQFWCTANFYRVRENAVWDAAEPPLNQAFVYRRALVVSPQKGGKSPDAA